MLVELGYGLKKNFFTTVPRVTKLAIYLDNTLATLTHSLAFCCKPLLLGQIR